MLKKIVIIFSLILWPINLFLTNTFSNFLFYLIPAGFLVFSYYLYTKKSKYYLIPTLFIGIFQPKLLAIPVLMALIDFFIKHSKTSIITLIISLVIFISFFSQFKGQTIFVRDYEAQQLVLRNTYLYPNIFLARSFQNKPQIYLNKIISNFFALVDTNNYLFGFHPRPITITNQNLIKFSFWTLPFILLGLFYVRENKHYKFILASLVAIILSLSLLTNFDRNDFILWVPISLVLIHGINIFKTKYPKVFIALSFLIIIYTIPEIARGYLEKFL